ncbi:MAG: multifunctional CCA addition/repair protein [Granulosicoccus sp.]|nr:multifunctional CCA addition/repair protein [Granulosicoccus sp.]
MDIFLVGGAVRDSLLGLPVVDRDWVVVGSTPDEMLKAGYLPVGKDFPVFLHPETHEEYALARTERKTGQGYQGFAFHTDRTVTLEEDLQRRDLTINAIAQDNNGNLIDPFEGQLDIARKRLRHVSDAFAEDPVRLLRVARFRSRLSAQNFTVDEDTMDLMQTIVASGEAQTLVAERVWQEIDQALRTSHPRLFFETLRECGALKVIIPELDALFGVPQPAQWHPEIDTGLHTMLVLDQICQRSAQPATRFAALCHDLGKALTPQDCLPSHPGHEKISAELTDTLCDRLRAPGAYRDLAKIVARYHTHVHRAQELTPSRLTKLLAEIDVIRKPERFQEFLLACEADAAGRTGLENKPYPQKKYLESAAVIYRQVDASAIAQSTNDKSQIAERIRQARVLALKQWVTEQRQT